MSIKRNIFLNGVANVVQKLVRIADQLLLVPFFLVHWGAEYYGEWLTLSIIPSILAFSDLGFGSAVSNSFVLAYAAEDKQHAADLRKTGFLIISLSILLGLLLTAIVMYIGYTTHLFDKSLIDASDAMMAVVLLISSKLLSFYTQLVEGFFRSARKAALGSLIGSGNYLINILVGLVILLLGYGVVGYALSQFLVAIVYTLFYCWYGSRLIDLRNHSGNITRSDINDITKKGVGYLMSPVWQSVFFQGTTFAVRLTLGAEAVAIFNTVRTVCRSVNQMFSIINSAIFPDLQYEYGCGNLSLVQRYFRMAIRLSMISGLLGTLTLAVIGKDIYYWWTKGVLVVSNTMWYIFMLGILLNAVWWTAGIVYRMINRPYHLAVVSTITAFVSVGITYILSSRYGLIGAAVGCTFFELVMAIYVLPDSCNLLNIKMSDLWRKK